MRYIDLLQGSYNGNYPPENVLDNVDSAELGLVRRRKVHKQKNPELKPELPEPRNFKPHTRVRKLESPPQNPKPETLRFFQPFGASDHQLGLARSFPLEGLCDGFWLLGFRVSGQGFSCVCRSRNSVP